MKPTSSTTAGVDMPSDMVLVVDDSPDSLSLINDALEGAGIDVLVALEGRQALSIARKMKPDMILMDAIMPNMDGFEACRLLKTDPALASIPVIFMTGLTDTSDIVRGLEAGGVDYLTKPINPDELLARMRVHLSNARLTSSAQSALDSTGQHLMTVSTQGELRWATPQTYALLARARVDDLSQKSLLAPQIARWLEHHPEPGNSLRLDGLGYPLAAKLVNEQGNGEMLLKLVDGQRPTGAAMLREHLNLTERESEVLYWIANGKANREAAEILNMSPRTVNKHLEQIFTKLGVENRTAAAGVALRLLAVEA
ncbi:MULTISPECIES: response regulator transcription factor [unclassified Oceanobacter]|jgi:DNA-binding response OmpR family regulator/DNA-binding CsgD family transcriptional regulator|uniref:response regulator transcription factor n=1 Tax=unclassified Oceanobacter TaxID=2620260 RepID=UPI0026E318CA|nr:MULTISPECIES: response regulator transcription factor [unclassified Oceanobacter]MDO6683753.1 response regulator transcription factor [Oceanobacter sp. 5_MG-2023]MDP2506265.1 response regulator transcription factor [Oceanobacter sp. 3_MG-2023]MDP2546473.1 response regulator transcription factor [Oceanobacter sp. 4_MG-2023]MDP2609801.1 response regulator transcription factor [Oceanobacter sp. 1_MG-2023]MDP2613132.1 response regulator transcription factor [Oceanobacter sp. 2_MG-2023]